MQIFNSAVVYYQSKVAGLLQKTKDGYEFSSADLISEISKNAGKMSISGVQIKASVKLNKKNNFIEIYIFST